MSDSDDADPPRLIDEPGSDLLREALRGARADLPDGASVEAMLARFPPFPGGPPPSAPAAPNAPTGSGPAAGGASATGGALGKVAIVVAVAGVLGGAAYFGLGTKAPSPAGSSGIVISTGTSAPSDSAPPARSSATSDAVNTAPSTSAPPSAAPVATGAPSISRPASPATSADASGPTEIELLRDAQAALGSSPARALSLAAEHERRFPNGSLGQERDMIRIQALLALGRRDEARALADDFKRRHPGSAHQARLDDLFPPR